MISTRTACHAASRALRLCPVAAGLLTICACAPMPTPPESAIEVPASWSTVAAPAAAGASSLAQWWSRFNDPLLDELVQQALQHNTSVNSAQAALAQARALRDVAAAALWPTLGSSASAQRGSAGGHSTGNRFQAGIDASWTLDVFGANRHALDASNATLLARAASVGDMQSQIAAELGLDYILLRSSQARLAIAADNLALQQETLQITLWREQAGLVTALESEQARAAAEQTSALLPALRTAAEQTRQAIAVIVGRPPAALASVLAAALPVPHAAEDLVLALPVDTLRQRADVRAAEYAVAAALAQVDRAEAARWPGFSLSGSLGVSALTLGSLARSTAVVSSLLAGASLPLFDGGAARAQVRAQQAALEQARQGYRAAVLGALKDVEAALVALQGDGLRLDSLRRAAASAAAAALLARQRYDSGLVDFQTVLETQRTQLSTQDGVASASADLGSDQVRLYRALGGGWRDSGLEAASRPADGDRPFSSEQDNRTSTP